MTDEEKNIHNQFDNNDAYLYNEIKYGGIMEENQKIIGNRAEIKAQKGAFIALIVLAVLGAGLSLLGLVAGGDPTSKLVLVGMGLFLAVLGALMAVLVKLQDKKNASMKGTPTIILNDDSTLTLYLMKNKVEKIALADIAKVKFKSRVVATTNGFINTYKWMEDGTLVIKLKDGKTIKVPQVDKGEDVEKTINALMGNF